MKIAFTIATANYLAQAKTVGDSFLLNNPDYDFFIALLDKLTGEVDLFNFSKIKVVEIGKVEIPYLGEMVYRYSIFELSNALKPFFAEYIFATYKDVNTILYFDSDIFIYDSFQELDLMFNKYDIVFCPHIVTPIPLDGLIPSENDFFNAGLYNAGFFGIIRSVESFSFLSWWKERMRVKSYIMFERGLFVDQIWLNLVPIYYKRVGIIYNIGYNVAYWNLHERKISVNEGKYKVNNQYGLVFFHFSGYNFKHPEVLSEHQSRHSFEDRLDILILYEDYVQTVKKNQYDKYSSMPCFYVELRKGLELENKPLPNNSFLSLVKRAIKKILARF